jgi:hypothetical protein
MGRNATFSFKGGPGILPDVPYTVLGNDRSTAFWTGRWIQGQVVKDVAPSLLDYVSCRNIENTTVAAGLQGRAWVRQITGGDSRVLACLGSGDAGATE